MPGLLQRKGTSSEILKDVLKDPYVLEFLGLDENTHYSESDLESAIIDKLETFLLELGKGFLFLSPAETVHLRCRSLLRGPCILQPAPPVLCLDRPQDREDHA